MSVAHEVNELKNILSRAKRVSPEHPVVISKFETHAREKLMDGARALAGRIAACGPLAIRGAKRIVNSRMASGFQAARELSDSLRAALESTHDIAEGQAAILEGRAPRFTGR